MIDFRKIVAPAGKQAQYNTRASAPALDALNRGNRQENAAGCVGWANKVSLYTVNRAFIGAACAPVGASGVGR